MRQGVRRLFRWADAAVNGIAGSRYNPLYQSGTIAVALFVLLLVTGLYLVLFYRIGDPHGSIIRITAQPWLGRWIRSIHRYASDAAIVAIAVHAARVFFQRRSWGPRTLAWVSGVLLLGVFLIAGWTGFVMVWDEHGRWLAVEGARIFDLLPILAEPLGRTFVGDQPVPSAFFFVNLFVHVALPVGLAIVLWVHVSRLARVHLLPPRPLWVGGLALLFAASVVFPVGAGSPANPFSTPSSVPLDLFYGFWLPIAGRVSPVVSLAVWAVFWGGLLVVPVLSRPRSEVRPAPSFVDPAFCTGCTQCSLDCPYDAITMVAGGRTGSIAQVDPAMCVSCGICAGSCAPMGVGPPGRNGRDQLSAVREFIAERAPDPRDVLVIACRQSGGWAPPGGVSPPGPASPSAAPGTSTRPWSSTSCARGGGESWYRPVRPGIAGTARGPPGWRNACTTTVRPSSDHGWTGDGWPSYTRPRGRPTSSCPRRRG